MKNKEMHLFIIWEKARYKQEEIIQDIKRFFQIKCVYEISWSDKNYLNNITRFYGIKLKSSNKKKKHCGKGPFLLIIIEDNNPCYEYRVTSKGNEYVNSNIFEAKTRYRKWTKGGHKIHATNSEEEMYHDIMLLLGKKIEDLKKELNFTCWNNKVKRLNKDIYGFDGWNSIADIFEFLNYTTKYVVLRNFENLPNGDFMSIHEDIDILCDKKLELVRLLNAKKAYPQSYRVQYKVKVNSQMVLFDFREIGDLYYDKIWALEILNNRILNSYSIYTTDAVNYFFSLLYHALVNKPYIVDDYLDKLESLALKLNIDFPTTKNNYNIQQKILYDFMNDKKYIFTDPKDLSVFLNPKIVDIQVFTIRRRVFLKYLNMRKCIKLLLSMFKKG